MTDIAKRSMLMIEQK